jgi:phosphoglycolate phosphatase-like HAD superfamily hydrolase
MVRLVLFDVDGTLVHTGRAGSQAFAKTFATEFKAHDGIEKIKFAGRTDVSLVREFFGYHNIPATPENFQRFFERFVLARPDGGTRQWRTVSRSARIH